MIKKVVSFTVVFLILLASAALVGGYFYNEFLKKPYSLVKTEAIFEVIPGETIAGVAKKLKEQDLIKNEKLFVLYAKINKKAHLLKKGEYALDTTMTPDQILEILISGKSMTRSITISEGLNIFDIALLVEKNKFGTRDEFLKLVQDRELIRKLLGEDLPSLEGYLFPETYKLTKYETTQDLITQMVKMFLKVYAGFEQDLNMFQQYYPQRKWNRHQHVTFASIVEKETGAPHERSLVSSVFHNRLDKNMKLQTDPTVIYGVAIQNQVVPTNITKKDLLTPTPYNTYTNYGLPITPISNPGREALLAALKPTPSKFLYFVSQNDGTHRFSETLEEHNAAVSSYQLNPKAREGKSWRDLNK